MPSKRRDLKEGSRKTIEKSEKKVRIFSQENEILEKT